jgi:hypothetical protein
MGFNEAMCTRVYVYLLIFLIGFLQRDIGDMKYIDSIPPKLSHWVIGVFHSITKLKHLFTTTIRHCSHAAQFYCSSESNLARCYSGHVS